MVQFRAPLPEVFFYGIIMVMKMSYYARRKIRMAIKGLVVVLLVINIAILGWSLIKDSDWYLSIVLLPLPPDETPPTIILKGGENVTIPINKTFQDDGVEAYDARSETTVTIESDVNTDEEGDYLVKYIASDERGNIATAERRVKVIRPTGTVYLTFDDGPSPYTGKLLDVLKQYGVKATFFVTGAGPDDMIKREYDEGHAIGLHTASHQYSYIYSSIDNFLADLYAVQDRVKNITGYTSMLMRFPGGSSNTVSARYDGRSHIMSKLVQEVEARGFVYFDWNVLSGDAGETDVTSIVKDNVINGLKEGGNSVVLQHDVKDYSVDAVEGIIQYGLEHGYVFDKLGMDSFTAHHGVNN